MNLHADQARPLRLAYLTSQYPATSHTFIAREVAALRTLGVELHTFSIRGPSQAELNDELIRAEASTTFNVLPRSVVELALSHLQFLLGHPAKYLSVVILALRHRAPGVTGLFLAFAHFAEAVLLARELKRRKISHLHNHFANSAATVGYLAARLLGLPWSFTMHGISETDYPAGMMLGRKIAAATFVSCVSYFGRAQAMRLVPPHQWRKLHVVRCGLVLNRLPNRTSAAVRKKIRLISVGRLSPEKGQTGLLQAFASVASERDDVELVLVGDGPDSLELRSTAERLGLDRKVTFAGRLGEQDTLGEIARSDILVLSSFMEGLPVVLMEAMGVGTTVIASRVAGIPELVQDGETGVLFTPTDWDELAGCIRSVAQNTELRERLAINGRSRVAMEFDIRTSAKQLLQLFTTENGS